MTLVANLLQKEKKIHMLFPVVITSATIMQPSRQRYATFISLRFFVVVLDIYPLFPDGFRACAMCSNSRTISFRFIKIPPTQTCSSRSAADGGLKRIPEFRSCLAEQCIVKCQAKLSRRNIFFHSVARNATRTQTRNCARNNRSVFSHMDP